MSTPEPLRPPLPAVPTVATPKNGLAITAVVFSALFFIPLASIVGLVLGIVALASGRNKAMSIVAICLGGFFSFFIGIYAAIAIPAFIKFVRRSKSTEAMMNTRQLADRVAAMPAEDWAKLADADWTPAGSACGNVGNKFAANPAAWAGEPWKTLGFAVETPHYYQYRVARESQGFVVEARGDLDCDGIFSRFARHVTPAGPGPVETENEIE
jgi:hypothetical protein